MFYLTNVIDDMKVDFCKEQYFNVNILSRRFITSQRIVIYINLFRSEKYCEVSIQIPEDISKETLNMLPKWKGMEERVAGITGENQIKQFLTFRKSEEYEMKIFLLVMQDILDNIDLVDNCNIVTAIRNILMKWNTFFQFDKDYILSENVQQGLYGELYTLEKMLRIKGEEVVNYWTGCNAETHDFYCGKDAVEVKSSSAKGPDRVNINNEYQLDDSGLLGRLYLLYIKMKKSEVDGESLPDIIDRIENRLSVSSKISFYDKLLKVGYLHQMPELYTVHFRTRDENCYIVCDGFPRITSKTISKGIGSVDYIVSLDACNSFQITIESFYKGVDL